MVIIKCQTWHPQSTFQKVLGGPRSKDDWEDLYCQRFVSVNSSMGDTPEVHVTHQITSFSLPALSFFLSTHGLRVERKFSAAVVCNTNLILQRSEVERFDASFFALPFTGNMI